MSAEQAHDLLCRFQHLLEAVPLWTALYESSTSDGQIHYTVRQGQGNDISLFCVQATLQSVALRSLYELLSRVDNRKLWDTSFEAGQVLKELPCDFATACTEYIRLAGIFPVVKQRDMVVLSVNAQTSLNQIISASNSVQSPLAPTKKGYQRFNLSIGGCMLQEVAAGVELTQITDIGDLLKWTPSYVIRTCTQVLVPRFLAKVRKESTVLAGTLNVTSANDWNPPTWSQANQRGSRSAILSEQLDSSLSPAGAVVQEAEVEKVHAEVLLACNAEHTGPKEEFSVLPEETEVREGSLTETVPVQQEEEADKEDHLPSPQESTEDGTRTVQAEDAQMTALQSDGKAPTHIPLPKSDQQEEQDLQSAPPSPLPLPRQRAVSSDLTQTELAMRRLSYFGGGHNQYTMDAELESLLPGALDSSTGIQAAHRLSKALSQLELARRFGDEGMAQKSTLMNEEEQSGPEGADVTHDEVALIQEIRDAAQPFFSSSVEGLLFTPSTHLAVAAKSKSAQMLTSWLGSLSSVLYYLPGSRLFTRPRR